MEYSYSENIKFFSFRSSDLYKKASDEKQKAFDVLMELFTNNDLMGKEVNTKASINFIKAKMNELSGITKFEAITICRICDVPTDKVTKFTDIFDLISEWDMNTDLAEKLVDEKDKPEYVWNSETGRLQPYADSERPSEGMELPKLKQKIKKKINEMTKEERRQMLVKIVAATAIPGGYWKAED